MSEGSLLNRDRFAFTRTLVVVASLIVAATISVFFLSSRSPSVVTNGSSLNSSMDEPAEPSGTSTSSDPNTQNDSHMPGSTTASLSEMNTPGLPAASADGKALGDVKRSDGTIAPAKPNGSPNKVKVVNPDGKKLIDASVAPTKRDERDWLSPPVGIVGWYAEPGWPKPGWAGASILAGHINYRSSPDTFAQLIAVKPGATATISYDSGDVVTFNVVKSEKVDKDITPTRDDIWDYNNPESKLRMITCDPFTPLRAGSYEGNWVVWADLVSYTRGAGSTPKATHQSTFTASKG